MKCKFLLLTQTSFLQFYFILALVGLLAAQAFSSCSQRGAPLRLRGVHGLLIAVASLLAEHSSRAPGLLRRGGLSNCSSQGSAVVVQGLRLPMLYVGIFFQTRD